MNFLYVAMGGAIGAMARYAISLIPVKTVFPVLTFLTNFIGAALIGFIIGLASIKQELSPRAVLFLKTGVCGGFTTFSTFSAETLSLFENGRPLVALCYAFLSVAACVMGVWLGQFFAARVQ